MEIGLPIDSTAGFRYSKNQIRNSLNISYWVTFSSFVSYLFYLVALYYNDSEDSTIIIFHDIMLYLALGGSLITLSIFLTLDIPSTYALEPGNLLSYYRPQIYPTSIDNILSDSAKLFLDPISRYQFDDWIHDIGLKLNPNYEKDAKDEIRVERAVEKLILLMYLKFKIPKLVTDEIFNDELADVIAEGKINDFLIGEESHLPFALFEELVVKLQKEIPEIFVLIDRLLVEVSINPARFEENDPYIELITPDSHSSLEHPFRLFTYILNLGKKSVQYRSLSI
ncbi:MAG: hypothetical protein ACC656_13250, partial [Candidatus Heimdallarchaeota archaeon]